MANQNSLNNINKGDFVVTGDCYVGTSSPASPVEFNVQGDKSGADVVAEVRNISTDANSKVNLSLVSQGGDIQVGFQKSLATNWALGLDDDDSDSFKISQGSALGTNDTFVMTSDGVRTLPLQSAFYSYQASVATDVTGNSTPYTLGSTVDMTEIYDQNDDFDHTTGIFTAPEAARYFFFSAVDFQSMTSSHTLSSVTFISSSWNVRCSQENPWNSADPGSGVIYRSTYSSYIDMDALDTVYCSVLVGGSTKIIEVRGNTSPELITTFGGHLVC